MSEPPLSREGRAAVRRVLWVTLGLNVAVSAGKILVGKLTGSLSMVADGYHSLLDGSNNIIGLVVLGFAHAPPDRGHPYGHRKFENAATLMIGLGLLGLAYRLVENALAAVSQARVPEIGALNWIVMGATLAVNMYVTRYETREGRRLGSDYLVADAAHTKSDIYVTLGVVASFAGAQARLPWADAAVATAIAAFIGFLAARILLGSLNVLTDRAPLPPEDIARLVLGIAGVRECGDVRTRGGASAVWLDLVVRVDGAMSLDAAHRVADEVEAVIKAAHPQIVDIVVHVEPTLTD